MPDDERDKRKPFKPPPGVLKQIAPSRPETWEENSAKLTPIHPTPIPGPAIGRTPTPENILTDLDRRSKETKNTSLSTLQIVENHRRETREDITNIREGLNATNEKVDAIIHVVSDVRVEVGKHGAQNDMIISMLGRLQRVEEEEDRAEIQVHTKRRITQIEDSADEKKAKRKIKVKFWFMVITATGGLTTLIIGAIKGWFVAHC